MPVAQRDHHCPAKPFTACQVLLNFQSGVAKQDTWHRTSVSEGRIASAIRRAPATEAKRFWLRAHHRPGQRQARHALPQVPTSCSEAWMPTWPVCSIMKGFVTLQVAQPFPQTTHILTLLSWTSAARNAMSLTSFSNRVFWSNPSSAGVVARREVRQSPSEAATELVAFSAMERDRTKP